jgi:hypothetical protein
VVQTFLVSYHAQEGILRLVWISAVTGIDGFLFRASAFGLLLAAVFIDRDVAQQAARVDPLELTGPASRNLEECGISSRPNRYP